MGTHRSLAATLARRVATLCCLLTVAAPARAQSTAPSEQPQVTAPAPQPPPQQPGPAQQAPPPQYAPPAQQAAPPQYAPPQQPPPPGYAPPGYGPNAAWTAPLTPIEIHADAAGRIVEIYAADAKPGKDLPIVHCVTPCSAQIYAGDYLLTIDGSEETLAGKKRVSITGPAYLIVDPESPTKRWAGLSMAIVGTVAIPAGITLLVIGAADSIGCIDNNDPSCGSDYATPGLLLLVGGLALSPIGWVMFGSSFKPGVEVRPARVAARRQPWMVSVGGPRGSAGMQLQLAF